MGGAHISIGDSVSSEEKQRDSLNCIWHVVPSRSKDASLLSTGKEMCKSEGLCRYNVEFRHTI